MSELNPAPLVAPDYVGEYLCREQGSVKKGGPANTPWGARKSRVMARTGPPSLALPTHRRRQGVPSSDAIGMASEWKSSEPPVSAPLSEPPLSEPPVSEPPVSEPPEWVGEVWPSARA